MHISTFCTQSEASIVDNCFQHIILSHRKLEVFLCILIIGNTSISFIYKVTLYNFIAIYLSQDLHLNTEIITHICFKFVIIKFFPKEWLSKINIFSVVGISNRIHLMGNVDTSSQWASFLMFVLDSFITFVKRSLFALITKRIIVFKVNILIL